MSFTDDRWKQRLQAILDSYASSVEKLSEEALITMHREHLRLRVDEQAAITRTELGAHATGSSSDRMEPTPVRSEDAERDARRYQLLCAHLMLTGLDRGVCLTLLPSDSEAQRYRLLRDHVLSTGVVRHIKLLPGETTPFVMGKELYGETVEDAVDTLQYLTCTITPNWRTETIQ